MSGGTGDDGYIVDNTGDVVTEAAGEGADTVQSTIRFTLGANVENLTLTGTSNINGTGNDLTNPITGNSGNNLLDGGLRGHDERGSWRRHLLCGQCCLGCGDGGCRGRNRYGVFPQSYTLGANVENLTYWLGQPT